LTHVRSALLLAAGTTTLLLTACGSETSGAPIPAAPQPQTTSTSERTTSSSSPLDAPSSSNAAKPVGDVTKPGSQLKVGERAVVPFKYGTDKNGTVAITVTTIEQGTNADLAKFGDKAKGIVPFYIRVTVENVGGTDLAHSSISVRGLGADGKSTGVIISGETDKCQSETAKRDFTTAGAKYETCVLQAAREGSQITAASYDKGDDYIKSPLVWKS
jgi:hypothetical protein